MTYVQGAVHGCVVECGVRAVRLLRSGGSQIWLGARGTIQDTQLGAVEGVSTIAAGSRRRAQVKSNCILYQRMGERATSVSDAPCS